MIGGKTKIDVGTKGTPGCLGTTEEGRDWGLSHSLRWLVEFSLSLQKNRGSTVEQRTNGRTNDWWGDYQRWRRAPECFDGKLNVWKNLPSKTQIRQNVEKWVRSSPTGATCCVLNGWAFGNLKKQLMIVRPSISAVGLKASNGWGTPTSSLKKKGWGALNDSRWMVEHPTAVWRV